jgi:hypothetical protein
MFKAGDIIEMTHDAPYSATRPETKWMVYSASEDGVRIGTLPQGDYNAQDMIRLYGGFDSRTIARRFDANIRMFNVEHQYCKLSGNNAVFKDKLLQGDMWEEEKSTKKTWSRGKPRFTEGIDWENWTPF